MARFDVHLIADGGMAVDCQADILDGIGTRFVIPLVPPAEAAPRNERLNPIFRVEGEELMLVTQFATAVRTRELRRRVTSLDQEHLRIIAAIDYLTGTA